VLPELVTAEQDIWYQGSSTWFDRTADLRALLNGANMPSYTNGVPATSIPPGLWAKGSASWLERKDGETVEAYCRSYRYKLDRELRTFDVQMGLDLGRNDLLSPGDIVMFGVLGGYVHADLDYGHIGSAFDFTGGEVGSYAMYLKNGLFVDTLLNVHIMELDPNEDFGFPSSLDVATVGLRTDAGYRFSSFKSGTFIEPLGTLAATWVNIDGFSLGGNTITFGEDANFRGRLGLRVGTSVSLWNGIAIEPFVIGSLWGNLSGDNKATIVSSGTTFHLEDDLENLWGEVSVGMNFFNPGAFTSVFAKIDVSLGDELRGIDGKAGVRVSW
jgi:outer membrane autotransporter protein